MYRHILRKLSYLDRRVLYKKHREIVEQTRSDTITAVYIGGLGGVWASIILCKLF